MLGGTVLGGRRDSGTPEGMVGRWDGGDGRARGVGSLLGCGIVAAVIVFLFGSDSDVLISGWLGLFCQRGPRKIGPNADQTLRLPMAQSLGLFSAVFCQTDNIFMSKRQLLPIFDRDDAC